MADRTVLDVDVTSRVGALALRVRLATRHARIAIVGPSGAGKSMLLRVLAGLERRAHGKVHFLGEPWQDGSRCRVPAHRRGVGWVPQDARLFPHRSVMENLRFSGASAQEASELARSFGVGDLLSRRPRHLSGGEAQRVALARALLSKPRLLLLDEPFSALDRARRAEVLTVLRATLDASGVASVLVSHDERDVTSLAEEILTMEDGEIVNAGSQREGRNAVAAHGTEVRAGPGSCPE